MATTKRVVIVGGGFAGVWAAQAAADARAANGADHIEVELVNPRGVLVLRPRLYEADPAAKALPLAQVLNPIGVGHTRATVTGIDTTASTVAVIDEAGTETTMAFDRLILAAGSHLAPPPFDPTHIHDVDTIEAATAFDRHLRTLPDKPTIVVVGAGFTGIELATQLTDRAPGSRVVLIERDVVVGPELGPGPRPVIVDALATLDVETHTGVSLIGYDGVDAQLDDGSIITADAVVWTGGMRASGLTALVTGERDGLGRLAVDQRLRVAESPTVFAAGDTAAPLDEAGHVVTQSCQHAMPQGTCAGHNAVADLLELPLNDLETGPYQTCLDLGPAGAVYTQGWARQVKLSGPEAKALKHTINTKWIYPPEYTPEVA